MHLPILMSSLLLLLLIHLSAIGQTTSPVTAPPTTIQLLASGTHTSLRGLSAVSDQVVWVSGSSGQVCVGTPPLLGQAPLTYDCHLAAPEGGVANIFFVVKVADDGTPNGTAYVVYSDGKDIFLRHSTDKGVTWSQRVRVSRWFKLWQVLRALPVRCGIW